MIGLEHLFLDVDGRPATTGVRWARALVAAALGAVPLAIVIAEARGRAALRSRPAVPCVITASGVDRVDDSLAHGNPYRPWVRFTFEYGGRQCHGNRLTTDATDPSTDDAAEAYATAAGYVPGMAAVCRVNGTDLSATTLDRPPAAWEPWAVPTSATVLALVLVAYCWPQVRATRRGPTIPGRWRLRLFGGAMAAFGGMAVIAWWGLPLARTLSAQRWSAVPCVVESAHLQSSEMSNEAPLTVCRTDVLYRFVVDGRTYHANCYTPTEMASPWRSSRQRATDALPPGTATVCYVDPADPKTATLRRHVAGSFGLALWPAAFVVLGTVMLIDGRDGGPAGQWLTGLIRRRWMTLTALLLGMTTWAVFGRP